MEWPSSRMAQIVKAKRYVAEPERFSWQGPNRVTLQGKHHTHTLTRDAHGDWHCTCSHTGPSHSPCSHIRAVEMLQKQNRRLSQPPSLAPFQLEATVG